MRISNNKIYGQYLSAPLPIYHQVLLLQLIQNSGYSPCCYQLIRINMQMSHLIYAFGDDTLRRYIVTLAPSTTHIPSFMKIGHHVLLMQRRLGFFGIRNLYIHPSMHSYRQRDSKNLSDPSSIAGSPQYKEIVLILTSKPSSSKDGNPYACYFQQKVMDRYENCFDEGGGTLPNR